MLFSTFPLFFALALPMQDAGEVEIFVDTPYMGQVLATSPVQAKGLPQGYDQVALPRAQGFLFVAPQAGSWTIRLHSHYFDSYLLIQNAQGNFLSTSVGDGLSRNDDGWYGFHSQIILSDLDIGQRLAIRAIALHGKTGAFTLHVEKGAPEPLPQRSAEALRLKDLQEGIDRLSEAEGKESAFVALARYRLGEALFQHGQMTEARSELNLSLAALEREVGLGSFDASRTRSLLADVCLQLGDNSEARRLWEDNLKHEGEDPFTLIQLGRLHLDQKNLLDADEVLMRAALWMANNKSENIDLSLMLNLELGRLSKERYAWDAALFYWETALGLTKRSIDFSPFAALELRLAMGEACQHLGQYEKGYPLLEEAAVLAKQLFGERHPKVAKVLGFLGVAAQVKGNPAAAVEFFQEGKEIFRDAGVLETSKEYLATLQDLASAELQTGAFDKALQHALETVAGGETRLWSLLAGLSEYERLAFARFHTAKMALLLSVDAKDDQSSLMQYEALLRWKGQISRSLSASQRHLTPKARAVYNQMKTLDGQLWQAVLGAEENPIESQKIAVEYASLQRTFLNLTGTSRPEVPRFSDVSQSLPINTVAVDFYVYPRYRKSFDDGSPWGNSELVAWVFTAGQAIPNRVDLGPVDALQGEVESYLDYLVPTRGGRALGAKKDRPGTSLRKILWDPLKPYIGESSTVFVSPDSFLATLPLETLPVGEEEFLIEQHAFVYAQDMVSLAFQEELSESREGALFVVGGVAYDGEVKEQEEGALSLEVQEALEQLEKFKEMGLFTEEEFVAKKETLLGKSNLTRGGRRGDATTFTKKWDELSATLGEAKSIRGLFKDQRWPAKLLLLTGEQASESRVKDELPNYRYIHLATHGFFEPEELPNLAAQVSASDPQAMAALRAQRRLVGRMPGLLSGLVFAGVRYGETGDEDGYLTAEEVASLDLTQCDLMVLSACNTATGAQRAGEGMMGLRRSFRQAGARTVLSSLWPVDDEATAELMKSFYLKLWEGGQSKVDALAESQREMLRKLRIEGRQSPRLWGAFVLSGDWR